MASAMPEPSRDGETGPPHRANVRYIVRVEAFRKFDDSRRWVEVGGLALPLTYRTRRGCGCSMKCPVDGTQKMTAHIRREFGRWLDRESDEIHLVLYGHRRAWIIPRLPSKRPAPKHVPRSNQSYVRAESMSFEDNAASLSLQARSLTHTKMLPPHTIRARVSYVVAKLVHLLLQVLTSLSRTFLACLS